MAERVFLDACVLYAALPRMLAISAARAGLLTPLWSARVMEEWRIAAARRGFEAEDVAIAAIEAMRAEWLGAEVPAAPELEAALDLPDAADAHVAAAASEAQASALITFNIKDFPARRMAGLGVAVRHPDGFFWELLSQHPQIMRPIIDRVVTEYDHAAVGGRKLLRKAALPRLGKAWETA